MFTGALASSQPVIEGFLALGAEIIAAGTLRTELDTLRAALQHHERLHVAECDVSDADGFEALLHAATKDLALDGIIYAAHDDRNGCAATVHEVGRRFLAGSHSGVMLLIAPAHTVNMDDRLMALMENHPEDGVRRHVLVHRTTRPDVALIQTAALLADTSSPEAERIGIRVDV